MSMEAVPGWSTLSASVHTFLDGVGIIDASEKRAVLEFTLVLRLVGHEARLCAASSACACMSGSFAVTLVALC